MTAAIAAAIDADVLLGSCCGIAWKNAVCVVMRSKGLCELGTTVTSSTQGFVRNAMASVFKASIRRSGWEAIIASGGRFNDKSKLLDPGTHARVG